MPGTGISLQKPADASDIRQDVLRDGYRTSAGSNSQSRLDARDVLQKSIDALAMKQKDYESALQGADLPSLRLLFADSASVICDCIGIVSETARECGIFINTLHKERQI